jgi:conjugative transposon TraK protein
MFQHFKNIDTAFKHVRLFSFLLIAACTGISCFAVWKSYESSSNFRSHIYVLVGGQALEAIAEDRQENVPVEARDHIRTFLHDFFTLTPDDKKIRTTITRALYLADASARRQYNDLAAAGYYNNIVSGNVIQEISVDSIQLDMNVYPYAFKAFAVEKLTRADSTTRRPLVTQGFLRNVGRSDNNPHGFLIEHWQVISNQ